MTTPSIKDPLHGLACDFDRLPMPLTALRKHQMCLTVHRAQTELAESSRERTPAASNAVTVLTGVGERAVRAAPN